MMDSSCDAFAAPGHPFQDQHTPMSPAEGNITTYLEPSGKVIPAEHYSQGGYGDAGYGGFFDRFKADYKDYPDRTYPDSVWRVYSDGRISSFDPQTGKEKFVTGDDLKVAQYDIAAAKSGSGVGGALMGLFSGLTGQPTSAQAAQTTVPAQFDAGDQPPKSKWPWLVGGVLVLGLAGGGIYLYSQKAKRGKK